jgi:hypothetical protein
MRMSIEEAIRIVVARKAEKIRIALNSQRVPKISMLATRAEIMEQCKVDEPALEKELIELIRSGHIRVMSPGGRSSKDKGFVLPEKNPSIANAVSLEHVEKVVREGRTGPKKQSSRMLDELWKNNPGVLRKSLKDA